MPITFNFEPKTTKYSSQNAYWLAKAAELANTSISKDNPAPDRNKILAELKSWSDGFKDVQVFDRKSTQSFVAGHEDFIIASFRGSDQWQDWLDNLNLPTIPTNLGRAHRGFLLALNDVWQDMLAVIERFKNEGIDTIDNFEQKSKYRSLWITGHSLGGALATLAAAERIDVDRPFGGVYTFGQPRCVDRTMARNMNIEAKNRIFRFQNNNDIISRIPQRVMGYSHVGTFHYIDINQKIHTDIHWWNQFLDRFGGILEALEERGIDKFEDHRLERYVEALGKILI